MINSLGSCLVLAIRETAFFAQFLAEKKTKSALATQANWVQSVYGWNEQRPREQATARGLTLADRAGDSDEICSRVPYRQRVEVRLRSFFYLFFASSDNGDSLLFSVM